MRLQQQQQQRMSCKFNTVNSTAEPCVYIYVYFDIVLELPKRFQIPLIAWLVSLLEARDRLFAFAVLIIFAKSLSLLQFAIEPYIATQYRKTVTKQAHYVFKLQGDFVYLL